MSIRLNCPNGHLLETANELAGKKVRCSICQAIADVPQAAAPAPPRVEAPPPPAPLPDPAEFRPRPLFTPVAPSNSSAAPQTVDHLEVIAPEILEEVDDDDDDYVMGEMIAPAPDRAGSDALDDHITPRRREARQRGHDPDPSSRGYRADDWDDRLPRRRRTREQDEERHKKKQRRKHRRESRAMKMVRLGLGFHAAKVLAWLLSILLFMIMMISIIMIGVSAMAEAAHGGRGSDAIDAAQGIALLFGSVITILYLIAPFLGITGSILCCFVPPKTRARPLIFTSLILDGIPILLGIVAFFLGALATQMGVSSLSRLGAILTLLAFCCNVAALVLFMLFVKAIASYYGDRGTGNEAIHVMIHLFVIAIGGFAVMWGSSYILRFVFIFGPVLQIGMFFGWIIMIIKIVIRLFNVIQTARSLIG